MALAHILFKVAGTLVFLPFLGPFARAVQWTAADVARQIANAHTLFNLTITVVFLPFTLLFANLLAYLVPEAQAKDGLFRARYLEERMLEAPALALGQATREALRVGDIVSEMLAQSMPALSRNDPDLVDLIEEKDNQVDALYRDIKHYLTRLSGERLTDIQARRKLTILAFADNMESIGDIVDRNLMELAKKRLRRGVRFSDPGIQEIEALHKQVLQSTELAIAAFGSNDPTLARRVLDQKQEIGRNGRALRQAHIQRLHDGLRESMETSEIHLDILTNLQRISSHLGAIATPILESA